MKKTVHFWLSFEEVDKPLQAATCLGTHLPRVRGLCPLLSLRYMSDFQNLLFEREKTGDDKAFRGLGTRAIVPGVQGCKISIFDGVVYYSRIRLSKKDKILSHGETDNSSTCNKDQKVFERIQRECRPFVEGVSRFLTAWKQVDTPV